MKTIKRLEDIKMAENYFGNLEDYEKQIDFLEYLVEIREAKELNKKRPFNSQFENNLFVEFPPSVPTLEKMFDKLCYIGEKSTWGELSK